MTPEAELRTALDAAPEPVTFWWRDDDAGEDSLELARLLALAEARAVPVALAVVPAWLTAPCAERIRGCRMATVLQHGFAHADHGSPEDGKIELGGAIPPAELAGQLAAGRRTLVDAFADRFQPVMVPPWNRIADSLVPTLSALGFHGLSTFGPRPAVEPAPGLRQVNIHLDLILWQEGSRPLAFDEIAQALTRLVQQGMPEPLGIMSHHRVMNDGAFAALDRALALVQDHACARLATADVLFGEA